MTRSPLRPPRRRPLALAAALVVLATATPCLRAAEPTLATDDEKTLYALGLVLARQLGQFRLTEAELATVLGGIRDGALQKTPRVEMREWGSKIQPLLDLRLVGIGREAEEQGRRFREAMAAEPTAVKAESGLIYFDQEIGSGPVPGPDASVRVNYHSTFPDGTVVDSTVEAGRPLTLKLGATMPCLNEGIPDMHVGGKRKLICPPELAYGETGRPPKVPPHATLVFEVELLEIVPAETPSADTTGNPAVAAPQTTPPPAPAPPPAP